MALATWWRGDALPTLVPVPGFRAEASRDEARIAYGAGLDPAQVRRRLDGGHLPYLAYIAEAPVGYGWLAQRSAEIRELDLRFTPPPTERYRWDFATLPAWQGYGVYPRLLQSILRQQAPPVERVWIIAAPENTPSGVGRRKAGLAPVGQLSFRSDGGAGLVPFGPPARARAGAGLLRVPIMEEALAPCGSATLTPGVDGDAARCWPPLRHTATRCTCAVEVKPARVNADPSR